MTLAESFDGAAYVAPATVSHATVLLIARHRRIAETLAAGLREYGFDIVVSLDVIDLNLIARTKPDLILIERLLDEEGPVSADELPVLHGPPVVVIGQPSVPDVVTALNRGVAEYIVAPHRQRELVARLRSVLRRTPAGRSRTVVAGDLQVDLVSKVATLNGMPLHLAYEDVLLLAHLAARAGRVVTTEELIRSVWGPRSTARRRTITQQVRRIRARVETDPGRPERVLTVRSVGYRYAATESAFVASVGPSHL